MSASEPTIDVLVKIIGAEIVKIQGDNKTPLATGTIVLCAVGDGAGGQQLQVIFGETTLVVPKATPVIKKEARLFVIVLPDGFFGLSLGPGVPDETLAAVEGAMDRHASLRLGPGVACARAAGAAPGGTAGVVAGGIVAGGALLAGGILATADITGELLKMGGDAAKAHLRPVEQAVKVPDSAMRAAEGARSAAVVGKDVVGGVATTLGAAAVGVGGIVAGIAKGTSLGNQISSSGSDDLRQVAAASLGAVGEVFGAVDTAARQVLTGVQQGAADVVGHKYGEQAGSLVHTSLGAAVEGAEAVRMAGGVGVKAVAKKAAKAAAADFAGGGAGAEERAGDRQPAMA
mmetsp:Transcript_12594/g.39734  ORF Transcript_12594/g.39734 Transcript_12594/m.39734 type:complete len:345 (-) Transcript_12594:9-1043(-)